jgi:hypothetical protein
MEELAVDAIGEWESEGGAPAQSEAGPSLALSTAAAPNGTRCRSRASRGSGPKSSQGCGTR